MNDIWPLLTYIYSKLLFLLVITLVIRAAIRLVAILSGRKPA